MDVLYGTCWIEKVALNEAGFFGLRYAQREVVISIDDSSNFVLAGTQVALKNTIDESMWRCDLV